MSDVFLKALQSIGRYRPGGVPIVAWLLRIATNKSNTPPARSVVPARGGGSFARPRRIRAAGAE